MAKQYYIITGCNEGRPIKPYLINDQDCDVDYHLRCYGDSDRKYTPVTPEEAIDFLLAEKLKAAPIDACSLEWDFSDDPYVKIGEHDFSEDHIRHLLNHLEGGIIVHRGIKFDERTLREILSDFIENRTPVKQQIIDLLVEKQIAFDDDGAVVTARLSGKIFGEELLQSYEFRFNDNDMLTSINSFLYHYDSESTLKSEIIEMDTFLEEVK